MSKAPPSPYVIERVVSTWQRAQAALNDDPHLADDEMAVATAYDLDPHTVHPDKLIERLVQSIAFATARAQEAKYMEGIMRARRERYTKRIAAMRTDLFGLMELLKYKAYPALAGSVSIGKGPQSVLVTDEQKIPDEYFKTERKLKRRDLLDDLKHGAVVDGAFLSNGAPTLTLRGLQPITESIGEPNDEAEERDGESGEPASGAHPDAG
jgi:Siphovirus Gp157